MPNKCELCGLPVALGFGPRPAGYCKCPISAVKKPPCDCGNENASWHGDHCGRREYCCDKCWQAKHISSCPRCGGKVKVKCIETYSVDSSYHVIRCEHCGCQIELQYKNGEPEIEAGIKHWNNQPRIKRYKEQLAEARAEIERLNKNLRLLLCKTHLDNCEAGLFNSKNPDDEPCLICLMGAAERGE